MLCKPQRHQLRAELTIKSLQPRFQPMHRLGSLDALIDLVDTKAIPIILGESASGAGLSFAVFE